MMKVKPDDPRILRSGMPRKEPQPRRDETPESDTSVMKELAALSSRLDALEKKMATSGDAERDIKALQTRVLELSAAEKTAPASTLDATVTVEQSPWNFDILRDERGLLKRVVATPKRG